jgi:hypothetical protein
MVCNIILYHIIYPVQIHQLVVYFHTYLHAYSRAYLATCSIEQISSWEANRFSASQEIPRILYTYVCIIHTAVLFQSSVAVYCQTVQ